MVGIYILLNLDVQITSSDDSWQKKWLHHDHIQNVQNVDFFEAKSKNRKMFDFLSRFGVTMKSFCRHYKIFLPSLVVVTD